MERGIETSAEGEDTRLEADERVAAPDELWAFARRDAERLGKTVEEWVLDLVEQAYVTHQEFERLASTPEVQERMERDREGFMERVREHGREAERPAEQA